MAPAELKERKEQLQELQIKVSFVLVWLVGCSSVIQETERWISSSLYQPSPIKPGNYENKYSLREMMIYLIIQRAQMFSKIDP